MLAVSRIAVPKRANTHVNPRTPTPGFVIATLLATAACGDDPTATHATVDRNLEYALVPCEETGARSELRCGRLAVPEDPERPEGRQIERNIVVAPARNAAGDAAGLFLLEGGPGVAASNGAEFFLNEGAAYRDQHDVVMVDLRGTGGSNPLHCAPLQGSDVPLQRYIAEMYPADEVAECRKLLEPRADLRQYATANAVEDIEAVRQALGYSEIDLQAISYGTRLALEYARRYPQHVRTLAAIGSLPPQHRMPLHHAASFERAFDLLIADCEGDPECREAFPMLRNAWQSLLESMAEPVVYRYEDPSLEDGGIDLTIRRDVFVEELRSAMYYATQARSLPLVVVAASRGDFDPFLELALPDDPEAPPFLAKGAYLSFTCTDDLSRIRPDDIAPLNDGTYLGDYRVSRQMSACEIWPSGPYPTSLVSEVEADVPGLLVTGDRDPVTPPSDAQQMARWLPNSKVVIVPNAGHMPFDGSDSECIDRIMLAFLRSAAFDDIDLSCVNANEPPPFAVK